jgi:hypothetical protein
MTLIEENPPCPPVAFFAAPERIRARLRASPRPRIGCEELKMREKTKVVCVLRRNWDGKLYLGLVDKLPMTFESKEEAEEYLLKRNFG